MAYAQVLRSATLVTPVSNGTAQQMQQYFGQALKDTTVRPILNGNDFYRRIPPEEVQERTFPVVPTLLSVGDIKPRKGQHLSLAAFGRVKQQLPNARYTIAGRLANTSYYRRLLDLVARLELKDVYFLGAVSDAELRDLYRQASVFVLTPQQEGLHFEGFGLVYLEAGAYGLPVVGTRSGGVPDAVQDGVTGLLVDPQDAKGAAQALLRLLQAPDLAREMGRANRRWAETLTWERCAAEYYQAYRSILEAG
jgi:glycosyltransferase involved in cell wall biosynthesis